jgi:hypothetical protein
MHWSSYIFARNNILSEIRGFHEARRWPATRYLSRQDRSKDAGSKFLQTLVTTYGTTRYHKPRNHKILSEFCVESRIVKISCTALHKRINFQIMFVKENETTLQEFGSRPICLLGRVVSCSMFLSVSVSCSVLLSVSVSCSVLLSVSVRCSVLLSVSAPSA